MAVQKPSHTFTKIQHSELQTNQFHTLLFLSFLLVINSLCWAQDVPTKKPEIPAKRVIDTSQVVQPRIPNDTISTVEVDSIVIDTLSKEESILEAIVSYKATDYTSINQKKEKFYLYNEAEIVYQDMQINAGIIVIDYAKNEVYAGRLKDSLGNYSQAPIFKQGADVIEPDSIRFNFDTKRALVWNSKTEQQGGTIISDLTKKENDSVYFVKDAKFTTSENLDDPEYYFLLRKAKIVPGKKVVTGLTNMYIYDVPTPIGLPFAFFPLTKKQTSGVIIPSFGEDSGNNRGYFLQNGGYYFAISDYVDLAVLGDYYTNGSYALRFDSNYALRYKFNGNLSVRFENLINSERGFPDFSQTNIYNIRWSHSQDRKSSPNSRFSASVNLGSSRFFQTSINQLNLSNSQNNTLASSVSYSKTFPGEPQVNLSMTATHSQNTQTEVINMTLPTFQGSVDRIFPFAPKSGSKKGIIQNINFQYNVRGENRITTTDSLFFKKEMFDDAEIGFQHNIPVNTNFKLFNYLSVSAGAGYQETWVFKTIDQRFNQETQEVVRDTINGFDAFRTYNFNASLGTTLYGMFNFGEDKKIQAIRHVLRPNLSYNISPAFDQYYDSYEIIDADGNTQETVDFTRFEGSTFGAPSNIFSSNLGIQLSNTIEAKVRDKDSTATEPKKITIFNNLNFSTNYNFAADSLNWQPVRMTGQTAFFDKKMNVNFGATFDPYALDSNNNRINTFNINNGGSLFRLTSANIAVSYTLNSATFKSDPGEEKAIEESLRSGGRADDLFGRPQDFADQRLTGDGDEKEEEEVSKLFYHTIPWRLRLAYALNYNNTARQNEISSHSLMFSGDIDLSPRWTIGVSSGYDVKNQGFTFTQLRFERDLLSWKMNFSWVPFSQFKSWNFFIGISSNLLKDLKYDQRRQQDRQL